MARISRSSRDGRGFTVVDALGLVAACGVVMGLALPALSNPREVQRQNRDASNMRAVIQAFNAFAPDNHNRYPTPSDLDRASSTVALGPSGDLKEKNTTGNILSILIHQWIMTPEMFVSPRDRDGVRVMRDYEYAEPAGAIRPDEALWDPRFKGTPWDHLNPQAPAQMDRALVSHNSYAHLPVAGARRALWQNTVSASVAVLSNRGPVYELTQEPVEDPADWRLVDGPTGSESPTLGFYGPPDRWHGIVAFADASVRPLEAPTDDALRFSMRRGQGTVAMHDNIFVDEPWEGGGVDNDRMRRNIVLRTFWRGIPHFAPFDASLLTDTNKHVYIDGAAPPEVR